MQIRSPHLQLKVF